MLSIKEADIRQQQLVAFDKFVLVGANEGSVRSENFEISMDVSEVARSYFYLGLTQWCGECAVQR